MLVVTTALTLFGSRTLAICLHIVLSVVDSDVLKPTRTDSGIAELLNCLRRAELRYHRGLEVFNKLCVFPGTVVTIISPRGESGHLD